MHYLKNVRVYLSGPIESDKSKTNWRTTPIKKLTKKFQLNLFDPFQDPKQQWAPQLKKAKENKNYKKVQKIARSFVKKDLAMVDRSDFLIAYIPFGICTTGTVHEIINSVNSKKPTLLVTNKNDISYIPSWYFGFIKTKFMFAGWDALYKYLKEVDEGKHKKEDKWSFVYGLI